MILSIQLALIALLLVLSAFFAGSETGVYRLSRLKLRIQAEQGKRRYELLFSIMRDGQALILSLLLGNNLVNYLMTGLVTVMLFNRLQNYHAAEVYTTVIITPVIFIFGEIVPKNIFYYRANTLVPRLVWLNWLCLRLFTLSGAVPLLKGLLRILSAVFRFDVDTAKAIDATQRHQVRQIIHETQEEGLLSESQKDMMSRLIDIAEISVASVMIRLRDVEMVPAESDHTALLEHIKRHTHTRQLVYDKDRSNIAGYIQIYNVLGQHPSLDNLREVTAPLLEIQRGSSVLEAINLLRNNHAKIALVVEGFRRHKRGIGIITITDLVEELTGELNP